MQLVFLMQLHTFYYFNYPATGQVQLRCHAKTRHEIIISPSAGLRPDAHPAGSHGPVACAQTPTPGLGKGRQGAIKSLTESFKVSSSAETVMSLQ